MLRQQPLVRVPLSPTILCMLQITWPARMQTPSRSTFMTIFRSTQQFCSHTTKTTPPRCETSSDNGSKHFLLLLNMGRSRWYKWEAASILEALWTTLDQLFVQFSPSSIKIWRWLGLTGCRGAPLQQLSISYTPMILIIEFMGWESIGTTIHFKRRHRVIFFYIRQAMTKLVFPAQHLRLTVL